MIKGVLLTAIDLVALNGMVPASIRKPLTYESNRKDVEQYARDLAECVCSTRHQVAHSKANYDHRGTECKAEDLPQFSQFLENAAAEVIRWYNRLPDHQKS